MHPPAKFKAMNLILALLCVAATASPSLSRTPTVIKFATLAPEGSSWMQIFKSAADEIEQKTGKAVKFKIYPGGVMGDERDMVRKMHIDQIHSAVLTSAGMSGIYPDMDVLQIPFLFDSYAEVDHVLGKMEPFFSKGLEESGYILLGWSEAGFIHLMSTVPIETIDKLKKAKVWIWSDAPMANAIFQEAGVAGVPLSIPDVLVGLQTGLVEVVYAPPSAAISLQWFTKIKHLNDTPLLFLEGGIVLKKTAFATIAAQHQTIVRDVFRKHFAQLRDVIRRENREALSLMQKQGVQFLTPAPEQVAEYKRISARAMAKEGSHKYSPEAREEVAKMLKAFREGPK